MTQVVIPVIWGVISADCVLPDLIVGLDWYGMWSAIPLLIVGDWYGMWSARPLLILEQCTFDSLKSPIPVNDKHCPQPVRMRATLRASAAVI